MSEYGLQDLFSHHESDSETDDDEIRFETIGDSRFELRCAHNDGSSPGALFAYTVWSGSVQIAEYLAAHPEIVVGKRVVEVGAAAALPSLAALSLGASCCLITDYPSENILNAIRVNVSANAALVGLSSTHWEKQNGDSAATVQTESTGDEGGSRCRVEGHLWGSPIPAHHVEAFDVCVLAECLWNHPQHKALLASVNTFLKPGGLVLLSYAHHVPGCEKDDDAFFTTAAAPPFGLLAHAPEGGLLESRPMRYMWDQDKTIQQMLHRLVKPSAATSDGHQDGSATSEGAKSREGIEKKEDAALSSQLPPEAVSGPHHAAADEDSAPPTTVRASCLEEAAALGHEDAPAPSSPTSATLEAAVPLPRDSATLTSELRKRAASIAAEEDAARRAPLALPKDEAGRAQPATLPGPRAPRHEDHPAFGMKVWPPPRPTATAPGGGGAQPAWVDETGDSSSGDEPDWARNDPHDDHAQMDSGGCLLC